MSKKEHDEKRPVKSHRDGAIEVAIWKLETDKGAFYNTERTRSYRDQDGNWQKTHIIPERDLLRAARLDKQAYSSIQSLRTQNRLNDIQNGNSRSKNRGNRER